jgi:hypothetical protein
MKAFFLGRALREKILLLAFTLLALLIWLGRGLGRGRALWDDLRATRAELAAQQVWLGNRVAIETRAAGAIKSLDPAKTINATRLLGELNTLAVQAGLNADIGAQRTERTSQFAFHSVQVNVRRADLAALLKLYTELSRRSPYIALEQCTLAVDRANPGQLNASFRVVAVELGPQP